MRLAIMQPYFLPYIGYFQLMEAVDKFVVLDDVNYIKGGWINRNRICSFGNTQWLTIPVVGASPHKLIHEVNVGLNPNTVSKLLRCVEGAYSKSPNFDVGFELFERIIRTHANDIGDFATNALKVIADYLDISCCIIPSSRVYPKNDLKGEYRILEICKCESATAYINLPGGKSIYSSERFQKIGVELKFIDPKIERYNEQSETSLSILDVIMHNSKQATSRMASDVVFQR